MMPNLSRYMFAAVCALATIPFGHAQDRDRERDRDRDRDWNRARQVVNRTMDDLRRLERRDAFAGEERERYDHSLRALAEVDRSLADGRFDRGRLDEAIEHVDHVTRSRVLDPSERDHVLEDLRDLRRVREEWR
jgi:hypothetical protein